MSAILVACRSCGSEVDSGQVDAQVRCSTCRARTAVEPELAELVRLLAKQRRYARRGHPCSHEQTSRVRMRINAKLHRMLPPEAIVGDEGLDARLMAEAEQRAAGASRILVSR